MTQKRTRYGPERTRFFGSDKIAYNGQPDLEQARTLGLSQTIVICIPWMICFAVYSLLLWSFPIDIARVQKETKGLESQS